MIKHPLNVFLLSLLLLCAIVTGVPISAIDNAKSPSIMQEQTPKVYIEPQNGTANVGQDYTISVKIANVTNLAGFGITSLMKLTAFLTRRAELCMSSAAHR